MALLEAKGIRILPLVGACSQVDSFSTWYEGVPFIFLATEKAASRVHYDAAHELGHLVMHEDVEPGSPEGEVEAHRFGSAFLLPRDSFAPECPRRWNLQTFYALKRRWYVSVQAMVMRAYQLGILSISSYRRAFAELNRRNMRRAEQCEWTLKQPEVLRRAIEMTGGSVSIKVLADEIGLPANYLLDALGAILRSGQETADD
jgi:Zn-dependent peptidase ImmA (M78 family)